MQSCASPDISEAIFETKGTNQVCEWLNDGINGDSVCYCKSDECNTIETLASWIQNGGVCKFYFSFFFINHIVMILILSTAFYCTLKHKLIYQN